MELLTGLWLGMPVWVWLAFIIVVLGTLVGGMVIAMYLPIFKLGTVVG